MDERAVVCRRAGVDDRLATRDLVRAAFVEYGPEETAQFVDALREDGCILGEWLAEEGGEPIAHIVFSRVWSDRKGGTSVEAAMLTPLSVRPGRQRSGVGIWAIPSIIRAPGFGPISRAP